MNNDVFEINSYEIDDLFNNVAITSNNVNTINDNVNNTFASYKKADVFESGTKKLNNQLIEIFERLSSFKTNFSNGTYLTFEAETKNLEDAENLYIPSGFELNDGLVSSTGTVVNLNKNDGLSVNAGEDVKNSEYEANAFISNVKMEDITNDGGMKNNELEFGFNGKMANLNELNQNALNIQEYSSNSSIDIMKRLENINSQSNGNVDNSVDINNIHQVEIKRNDNVNIVGNSGDNNEN